MSTYFCINIPVGANFFKIFEFFAPNAEKLRKSRKTIQFLQKINLRKLHNLSRYAMRIDKFLKISRVIKRRTVACGACDGGRIELNGKTAKPSREVKTGDTIKISFGEKPVFLRVLSVDPKAAAESMYEIL